MSAVKLLDRAIEIIETGDQRLLASDGPAGGRPPDISLAEWRELYETLVDARRMVVRAASGEPSGAEDDDSRGRRALASDDS